MMVAPKYENIIFSKPDCAKIGPVIAIINVPAMAIAAIIFILFRKAMNILFTANIERNMLLIDAIRNIWMLI